MAERTKGRKRETKVPFFWRTQLIQHIHDLGCRWLHASSSTKQKDTCLRAKDLPAASACPHAHTHTHEHACVSQLQPALSSTVQRLSPVEASLTQKTDTRRKQRLYPNGPESAGIVSQTVPLRLECSIYCFVSLDAGTHAHQARVVFFFFFFSL